MRDRDELPYVVIERSSGAFGAFIWGALAGAAAALLLAPRSGRETRDEIRAGALRVRDRAEDAVRNVSDSVTGTIGGVRGEVQDRLDAARDAFEAGRRAARESRQDMDARVRHVRTTPDSAANADDGPARSTETDTGLGV